MMDPRHALDTLFLFAESDFRLFESDCIGNEWLLIAGQKAPELIDEPVPEALQAGASRPAAGRGAPRPPQLWGWEGQRRSQPTEEYQTEHIECLNDIVRMCTLAHRHGLGNVVWLSYTCGSLGNAKSARHSLIFLRAHWWRSPSMVSVHSTLSLRARSRCILTCG